MEISFTPLDNACMAIKCKLGVTARSFLIHSATGTVTDTPWARKLCLCPNISGDQPFKLQAPPQFLANLSFLLLLLNHLLDASCESQPTFQPALDPCQSSEGVVRAPCQGRAAAEPPLMLHQHGLAAPGVRKRGQGHAVSSGRAGCCDREG